MYLIYNFCASVRSLCSRWVPNYLDAAFGAQIRIFTPPEHLCSKCIILPIAFFHTGAHPILSSRVSVQVCAHFGSLTASTPVLAQK